MCPERVPHLSAVQNFLQLSLLPKGGEEEQPTYSELEERRLGARGHISGHRERLCQTSRGAQLQLSLAAATLHNHHGHDRGTKYCFGRDRRRAKSQHGAWREREHERHPSAVREVVMSLELAAAALHSASGYRGAPYGVKNDS